jgi:hypothetical protein
VIKIGMKIYTKYALLDDEEPLVSESAERIIIEIINIKKTSIKKKILLLNEMQNREKKVLTTLI